MDVAVSELRAQLANWLERVRAGEEIVITERGVPIARLTGMPATTSLLERLTEQGAISRPKQPSRPSSASLGRVTTRRPVADRVTEQRR